MGPTGSGKSSVSLFAYSTLYSTELKAIQFIGKVTGNDDGVGHTLTSCTSEVKVTKCEDPTLANIVLVDTPGFDDTRKTDLEILELISKWLNKS